MRALRVFPQAVWEFVAGDDWRTALGVLALAITALIATTSVAAWWVMPIAVLWLARPLAPAFLPAEWITRRRPLPRAGTPAAA